MSGHDLDDLSEYLSDWATHLKSMNRAPSTIESYLKCGEELLRFLRSTLRSTLIHDITRSDLEAFFAALVEQGTGRGSLSPATVAKHYRSIQQLFRFLDESEVIDRSPFQKMHPPAVPEKPVPVLTRAVRYRSLSISPTDRNAKQLSGSGPVEALPRSTI